MQFLGDRYAVRVTVDAIGSLVCFAAERVAAGARVVLRVPLNRVRLLADGAPGPHGPDHREVGIRP